MIEIALTGRFAVGEHRVALVDDDDFPFLSQWAWKAKPNGSGKLVYAARNVQVDGVYKLMRMHRVIVGLRYQDVLEVDHINHNTLDNRKKNLRIVTRSQNLSNQRRATVQMHCVDCGEWFVREVRDSAKYTTERCEPCAKKRGVWLRTIEANPRSAVYFPHCNACGNRFTTMKYETRFCSKVCQDRHRG